MQQQQTDPLADNPFFVLGLAPDCSRQEIEREGQKLLGLLELGLSRAATYQTPLGPRERTPELVRGAMAELRDPKRRVVHELWADVAQATSVAHERAEQAQASPGEAPAWTDVWQLFDWRAP